ncbi:hypothetical protein AWM79_07730 [Pseudomonas agarici]|uniref:Uncharacterized protein n=1 Tax=Pseudomonas agarici TaxID=46677 RepID=A0A0X1SZJ8_PSEAA|nr:hypothetical protein AWM79_07730 [Pseudomonas agarici]
MSFSLIAGQAGYANLDPRFMLYGLDYPDATGRRVTFEDIGQWMNEARRQSSVGVIMRVRNVEEIQELALLPVDGKRYKNRDVEIIIFPQTRP